MDTSTWILQCVFYCTKLDISIEPLCNGNSRECRVAQDFIPRTERAFECNIPRGGRTFHIHSQATYWWKKKNTIKWPYCSLVYFFFSFSLTSQSIFQWEFPFSVQCHSISTAIQNENEPNDTTRAARKFKTITKSEQQANSFDSMFLCKCKYCAPAREKKNKRKREAKNLIYDMKLNLLFYMDRNANADGERECGCDRDRAPTGGTRSGHIAHAHSLTWWW